MPDPYGPSEFGGKSKANRVQPHPHQPTASERLSLVYSTGSESGVLPLDGGEAFSGMISRKAQTELRKQAGDLEKGQVWAEMLLSEKATEK